MKKQAEAFKNALTASEKTVSEIQKGFGQIGASLFNLSTSDFFEKVARSPELMAQLEAESKKLKDSLENSATALNKMFTSAFKNSRNSTALDKIAIQTAKLRKDFPEAAAAMEDEITRIRNTAGLTAKDLDFSSVLIKGGEDAADFGKALLGAKVAAGKLAAEMDNITQTSLSLQQIDEELKTVTKSQLSLTNAMKKFVERNFSLNDIVKSILSYDKAILDAQRATGIQFAKNTDIMHEMSIEGARFGLSTKDMADFMGQLGDTLNTTNFSLLGKAAMDTKAISLALGVSNQEVGQLTEQFMLLGKSSESVAEFSKEIADDSKAFGLNAKKVFGEINKNLPKFRQMGFQGGEESLKRMVITAQKLRMNVDEIFDVAKKARTIEGAMEMAASLQLAAGSFAQIDPMQLLAAARKSPEELTKLLGQMGNDIGTFAKNAKGEMETTFSPIDADRLQMVADATGMSVDSLQKQISKAKQRAFKDTEAFSKMPGLSEETKDLLDQFSEVGKNGEIKFNGAFDGMKMSDLRSLTQADIQARVKDYDGRQETLEEAAKQNKAFTDSLSDLKTSFINIFNAFEPWIRKLTDFLNYLNSMPVFWKKVFAGFVAAAMIIWGPAKAFLNGVSMGKGFSIGVKGGGLLSALNPKNWFGGGAGAQAPIPGNTGGGSMFGGMDAEKIKAIGEAAAKAAPGILALGAAILMAGGGIAIAALGLAQLVKSFAELQNTAQVVGAVLAIGVVMGGFVAVVYALSGAVAALGAAGTAGAIGLLALGASFLMIGGGIALASLGLSKLVESFSGLTDGQVVGALLGLTAVMFGFSGMVVALGMASTVAGPGLLFLGGAFLMIGGGIALASLGMSKFVEAVSQLKPEMLSDMGAGLAKFSLGLAGLAGSAFLAAPALIALAAAGVLAFPGLMMLGLGFTVLSSGVGVASVAMSTFVNSLSKLNPEILSGMGTGLANFSLGLAGLSGGMFLAIPALVGFGAAALIAAPGLLILSAVLPLFNYGFSSFADSVSKIKPEALTQVGSGLKDFSSGLLSMSASMFAFSNPISIIVFGAMIAQLSALSGVMSSLGPNLEQGANGITKMADGITKLSTAMSSLDTDKLNKIQEISSNMGATSALVSAVNTLTSAVGGGNGKSGEVKRFEIEVVVKNENGREISRRIIKDNELTH